MPGGSEQKTTSTSQATPYAPAQGSIDEILKRLGSQVPNADINATESGALDQLTQNAKAGNPYAAKTGELATGLLNGGGAKDQNGAISSAYGMLNDRLSPTASATYSSLNDPALRAALDQVGSDVSSQINGQFAAAGRDFSGMNQQTVARGVTQAQAPLILDQFNRDKALQQNAAGTLFNASNTTSGLLNGTNQQDNANRTAGVDVGTAALDANNWSPNGLLSIEAQRRGIPISGLQTLLGTVSPVAQAFGTNTGTSTSLTQDDPLKTLLSAAIAGGTMAAKFSDIRLKEDVAPVGKLADGTPVYRYRYSGSPRFEIGLIAQDIETRLPDAVSEVGGFKMVDYRKATARAAQMEAA